MHSTERDLEEELIEKLTASTCDSNGLVITLRTVAIRLVIITSRLRCANFCAQLTART